MTNLHVRFINAFKGLAVADAVGYQFEFDGDIPPEDVSSYAQDAQKLIVSDDTQMAFFTLEGVIDIIESNYTKSYKTYDSVFSRVYLNWLKTQTRSSIVDQDHDRSEYGYSFLLDEPSLYHRRAPGNTCLFALTTIENRGVVQNNSKGCGSVMRILPIILLREKFSLEDTIKLGQISGSVTHKHQENAQAIAKYIKVLESLWSNSNYAHTIAHQVHKISDIGEGWTAMECVDMGIWAFVNAESFEELLELSIAHDGDSDSTGAVAGSLWGMSGREIPDVYVDKLDIPLMKLKNNLID